MNAWREFKQNVAETVYFAAEPLYREIPGKTYPEQYAPSELRVWVNRNLPTIVTIYAYVKQWVAMGVCKVRGHAMVCEDWAGPESGGMAGHCERCGGNGYHHVLY